MSGKQLDEHIRAMLRDHQVPFKPDHWDKFEHDYGDQLGGQDLLDDEMIDRLKVFEAEPVPGDWDVLSSLLDHEDALEEKTFDSEIRNTVDSYEAPYESDTWPMLERKLTAAEIRRRRLFITKVLEVASILLLLITLYNFYPEIRSGLLHNAEHGEEQPNVIASELATGTTEFQHAGNVLPAEPLLSGNNYQTAQVAATEISGKVPDEYTAGHAALRTNFRGDGAVAKLPPVVLEPMQNQLAKRPTMAFDAIGGQQSQDGPQKALIDRLESVEAAGQNEAFADGSSGTIPSIPIKLHVPLFDNLAHHKLYGAIQPVTKARPSKRIGIYANAGINVLHFPADNFFSGGEQITFNAQDLPALGYGGGFSIGWFGRRFGFETGIQYSNKSFKPGRQLLIGESLENSKVDFQAVQIDLITVPLTLTYQIKPAGKLRFYTLGGVGFNLIAQAHYDLKIENNYPLPLSITQSASALASNREAHRIREHILDGATFKSKTHITAIVGFGLENYISPDLSLFVQPAYAHQIPLNRFSNNNGKNFKNLNIRFGARTTIH